VDEPPFRQACSALTRQRRLDSATKLFGKVGHSIDVAWTRLFTELKQIL
jgi:hypothetical protein